MLDAGRPLPRLHTAARRQAKDELLAAATSFFSRFGIRFKWALMRDIRPWRADDISAFLTWILLGHVVWIVVGTTGFMSVAALAANTVFAQESLATALGNYVSKGTGLTIVFENAIVPKWKDGTISFRNVFVSRRPGRGRDAKGGKNVTKGSSSVAAAAAAAAAQSQANEGDGEEEDDGNYTQFDLTIDSVDITLSFTRWMNGKGLVRDVSVSGMRGVVDRTHVHWSDELLAMDPKSFRHTHHTGDFELESFQMKDMLVTILQPAGFRPFTMSVFQCDLPRLRKQWMMYDLLSANSMSGSYDNSLFTLHPRQLFSTSAGEPSRRIGGKKIVTKSNRIRIDAMNIDHLNRGVEGPFGWITSGNVDFIIDMVLPEEVEDLDFGQVVSEIVENIEQQVDPAPQPVVEESEPTPLVSMDIRIQLNDVKAAVPLFTDDLSYTNYALIRPIVAYLNRKHTYIPLKCRVVKSLPAWDGSWTLWDSGLMDDVSAEVYDAFAQSVTDDQARRRRIKKIGLWSLQLGAQLLMLALPTGAAVAL
ncbi:Mitochondrial distribution and morphology protein 31, mitochondrial precursor [Saitoella coloradoensis]